MITEWTLGNFKAVKTKRSLEFRRLTIFVGANSSGKSTWIQSILLMAQTFSSQLDSYSIVLNGPLVKLGQFDDLLSAGSPQNSISVGCTLSATAPEIEYLDFVSVDCSVTFDSNPGGEQSTFWQVRPRLVDVNLTCTVPSNEISEDGIELNYAQRSLSIHRKESPTIPVAIADITSQLKTSGRTDEYVVTLDPDSLEDLRGELIQAEVVGCTLEHFLPSVLTVRFNKKQEIIKYMMRQLSDVTRVLRQPKFLSDVDISLPAAFLKSLDEWTVKPSLFHDLSQFTENPLNLKDWHHWLRSQGPPARIAIRDVISDHQKDILSILDANVADQTGITDWSIVEPTEEARTFLSFWFRRKLRYIGPLRDDPKVQYPVSSSSDPRDVGLRGEHTAAVLHVFKDAMISYAPPSEIDSGDWAGKVAIAPLHSAVCDWLQYLGIAENITTDDRGKFGHELRVDLGGLNHSHDLTHVGVGVSQVLPILVMALLAERGTCLIFEQPEIHLHPRVQSRLADFFLSMFVLDKQCVIETHSEYLINRLRLRSAKDEKNLVSENVRLYFSEKDGAESGYRPIDITPYGSINDWPKGFLDESQQEVEGIIIAAMEKRKGQSRG